MPTPPIDVQDAAVAVDTARNWLSVVSAAAGTVFGGGVVWGTGRSVLRDHSRRLEALESMLGEKMQRLEDKVDRNHNLIVSKLLDVKTE